MHPSSHEETGSQSWEDIAHLVAKGDGAAFERLYRRFEIGISHFFSRRESNRPEVVEELSQQAWVEIYRSLIAGHYDSARAKFSTYAYAVAYNTWLQYRRKKPRAANETDVRDLDLQYAMMTTPEAGPLDSAEFAERIDAVRNCLHHSAGLTADERHILMELIDEASERSLAEKLGLAASTIHARKKTACEKLKRCLEAKGFSARDFEREWE